MFSAVNRTRTSSWKRGRLQIAFAWLAFACIAVGQAPSARAEQGRVNVHVAAGASFLVTDAAAAGVEKIGADFTLQVDIPVHRLVSPQVSYGLVYLPGPGKTEAGVNLLLVGARFWLVNDEHGFLANLWPKGPEGNAWGNLWASFDLGYAHAPTVAGKSHWFAFQLAVGYEFSLASPIQMGPYLAYRHVVKDGTDASFVALGLSFSFGWPKHFRPAPPRRAASPPPRPNIHGRPGDRDGDGVRDGADMCPSTPPGGKVDPKGCEYIRGRMIFPGVRFVGQTAQLAPEAEFELRRVAELIRVHSEVQVEVGGHTDAPGSPADNLRLSLKRAERVRAVLVQMGVPARQLTARGYGVSAPLLIVGTPEQRRAKNIRIEFRFSVNQPPAE